MLKMMPAEMTRARCPTGRLRSKFGSSLSYLLSGSSSGNATNPPSGIARRLYSTSPGYMRRRPISGDETHRRTCGSRLVRELSSTHPSCPGWTEASGSCHEGLPPASPPKQSRDDLQAALHRCPLRRPHQCQPTARLQHAISLQCRQWETIHSPHTQASQDVRNPRHIPAAKAYNALHDSNPTPNLIRIVGGSLEAEEPGAICAAEGTRNRGPVTHALSCSVGEEAGAPDTSTRQARSRWQTWRRGCLGHAPP